MKLGEVRISSTHAYLLPISDTHIGDAGFDERGYSLLCENIKWVAKEKNARVFLNGDILNVATRSSVSSPAYQTKNLHQQIQLAVKIFTPIKDKIIGAIDGNHEERLRDFVGYSPTTALCHQLNIPYYGYSAVIRFIVGTDKGQGRGNKVCYLGYFHHTSGGGGTVGSKMNRVDKLRGIVCNCDFYVGSHNHQLGLMPVTTRAYDPHHKKIIELRQLLVDSGSYLEWDDQYSEAKMLQPVKLGSPRLRLDGTRKDIHCSI